MDFPQEKPWRVQRGSAELEWLLDYELSLALRYQRNVTLVLLAEARGRLCLGVLEDLMRRSDELFRLRSEAAILMSDTTRAGALKAIKRFENACLGQFDLRFALASFPSDGRVTGALLNAVHRRLNRALGGHRAAVVYTD